MDTGQSKHRLLIVDGDPKSLRVLEVSLKKAGFGVTTASNGDQAMAAMAGSTPDLIISDTDLDGTDGFALCRQIKSKPEWGKIPFLFVSGRKSIEDKIRGLELGVDDYLTKPIYIKEIGIRVRTALQRAERERLESRRDTRTKFSGDLADIGVVDLVQTIDLNRKSGIIHITDRDGRRGAVFFRDGRVIDAEVGRLAGTEAMHRLFSWSDGRFEMEFKPIRRRDVIESPTAALLMEGMRRLDEWTRLLETLPGLDKVVEVDCRVLADQLAELPDEVNGLLRLCDGSRSLLAVIDDSDYPDLEALTVASNLFSQHILYVREPGGHAEVEPSGELARWLEEGHALAADTSERVPQKPVTASTLLGIGKNEIPSLRGAEAEKDVRTFTGDLAPPSRDTPSPRPKPDDATPEMVPAHNTLRMPAPATHPAAEASTSPAQSGAAADISGVVTQDPNPPEPPATPSSESISELPAMSGVHPRKSGALSNTLRGIPVAQEQANSANEDASAQATTESPSAAPQSRITTIEYATRKHKSAESETQAEEQHEADWGGWAQGSENQGEPTQDPSPPATTESSSEAPASSVSSPEMPGEENLAPSRSHLRETLVLTDRLKPVRQRRTVPIVFSLGLLIAAGLLIRQIRSGESKQAASSQALAVAQQPAPAADAGSVQAVATQAAVLPDAGPALAVRADARPAERPKALAIANRRPDAQAPAESGASDLAERCRKLGASSRSKPTAILAACQAANQADPNATDLMVVLARVELDRGKAPEARSWAKKAVELKPDLADAYVFLGGAEQEAGNTNEAKAAYKKYLELAPSGRYARELRAVLNSLQ
jgi:CheY-like chemotaxis protein